MSGRTPSGFFRPFWRYQLSSASGCGPTARRALAVAIGRRRDVAVRISRQHDRARGGREHRAVLEIDPAFFPRQTTGVTVSAIPCSVGPGRPTSESNSPATSPKPVAREVGAHADTQVAPAVRYVMPHGPDRIFPDAGRRTGNVLPAARLDIERGAGCDGGRDLEFLRGPDVDHPELVVRFPQALRNRLRAAIARGRAAIDQATGRLAAPRAVVGRRRMSDRRCDEGQHEENRISGAHVRERRDLRTRDRPDHSRTGRPAHRRPPHL